MLRSGGLHAFVCLLLVSFFLFICSMSSELVLCRLWSVSKRNWASSTRQFLSGGQVGDGCICRVSFATF